MATKFLDNTGLAHFWSKIKSYIANLLSLKADDSAVVHIAGAETITGTKTFSSTISGSVSGNAGSATQFSANTTVALTGDVTGTSAGSKKGWSVPTTLANSGVTAGSYGPSDNATPGYGATFNVPYITVDAKGRVTAASTKTVKIPASDNADVKVTQTVSTDNAELPILTKASNATSTVTDTSKFAAAVKVNPSTGTLTATKFVGPLTGDVTGGCSGNAGSATKLATARNIGVSGAVTGSASFNGTANSTISTIWRSCMVGQSGSTNTNPWYKVASFAVTTANDDIEAVFLVENTYSTHTYGLLKLHVRTNGSKVIDANASSLAWISHNGFTLADFVLVMPTAASSTFELWTKIDIAYQYRRFTVLSEGSRTGTSVRFTFHPASSAGQAASITTTGTQKASTFTGQASSCTGNAATATKLATARTINIQDSSATNTGTGTSFDGSGNATIKLPATIKATITGNCSGSSGSCTGNAATATKLATARTINGVSFDGSANITVADSTKVAKAGDTMTGNLTVPTVIVNGSFVKQHPSITKGTNPSSTSYWTLIFADKDGSNYSNNCLGMLETSITSAGVVSTYIRAMKNTAANSSNCQISCIYDTANNTAYTAAPTPATADNSTKIATTAFVKAQGYLTSVSGTAGTSLLAWNTENTVYTVGGHVIKVKLPANPNTDTHWTSHLYAGASNGNANAATTNGNTYLIICDNSTARDRRLIKGTGATTVTSDADGVITIHSTDNNTTYSTATQSANGLMSAADKKKLDGIAAGADSIPVGAIIYYTHKTVPANFLICNGGAVSRTTYATLFKLIGTTYGTGNGSSTFNVPNLIDRFPQGNATPGTVKAAGLPNIKGSLDTVRAYLWDGESGAFYPTHDNSVTLNAVQVSGNNQGAWQTHFDASRSSAIYGKSSTVQPPALTLVPCIRYA